MQLCHYQRNDRLLITRRTNIKMQQTPGRRTASAEFPTGFSRNTRGRPSTVNLLDRYSVNTLQNYIH